MANYPNTDPSFSNKSPGQTIASAHVNTIQDEIVAIGSALRGTLQHDVTIASNKSLNVGGNSTITGSLQVGSSVTISSGGLTVSTGNVSFGQDVSIAGALTSTLQMRSQMRLSVVGSTLSGGSTRFDNVQFPSSACVVLLNQNSTSASISGISGGSHGRVLYLVNTAGGFDLNLINNSANSSADCRMQFASNTDKALNASGSVMLVYSTISGFWYGLASRT